jgi:hypothetical protein
MVGTQERPVQIGGDEANQALILPGRAADGAALTEIALRVMITRPKSLF